MSVKILKYSVFGIIGLTMIVYSTESASVGDRGAPSMSIPGIYMGTIDFDSYDTIEPITFRLGGDGTLAYITTSELFKETAALGSWSRVSRSGGVDVIEFATVAYIQTEIPNFCKDDICVVFGGGTVTIDQDGNMIGTGEFSYRTAGSAEDPVLLDTFTMELQKRSLEEIRTLAMPPSP